MPNYYAGKPHKKVEVEEIAPETIIKYVKITSRIDAHLTYFGKVSGRQYDWLKAGDTVSVLEEDAPELLSKRLGKKLCCGSGTNQIFEIVGGTHA